MHVQPIDGSNVVELRRHPKFRRASDDKLEAEAMVNVALTMRQSAERLPDTSRFREELLLSAADYELAARLRWPAVCQA